MTMQSLLDQIEGAGYVDDHGHLLTNNRAWHELRQCIKGHPGWPGVTQAHVHGDLDAPYQMEEHILHGFTPWHGGARPISSLLDADVVLRSGMRLTENGSDPIRWTHMGGAGDIIAYRVRGRSL